MKYILLLVIGLLVQEARGQAAPETLQPGHIYEAATQLTSPWTGLSFEVPASNRGHYVAEAKAFVMESQSEGRLIGIYGFSDATLEGLGDVVVSLLNEQGIQLTLTNIDQPDEETLRAKFSALFEGGIGSLAAIVRLGERGNGVAVAVLGAQGTESELEAKADVVLASISWNEPQARQWRGLLAGKTLTTSGASSHYSPGGAGGYGSYASGSDAQLDFCSDGSYAYASESTSYISIEGASAESTSSDAHQGQWLLVGDLGGEATLVLISSDGREFYWPIQETAGGAAVDGTSYAVIAGQRCY